MPVTFHKLHFRPHVPFHPSYPSNSWCLHVRYHFMPVLVNTIGLMQNYRLTIWTITFYLSINEEKILKIAIFDILVVLWAYNCLWQLPADWKIKHFCCHTKTLRSIITLSNVAVSFTIISACVYQIWGLGCIDKWFKSYDQKRDFTLFWKLTGSFCTAVLRKIRLCYWLAN